jgi:hypothetical protein
MRRIFVCLALLACAGFACASESRLEVTVHSGWSFLMAEEEMPACPYCKTHWLTFTTTLESSPLFGVKAAYYLTGRAGVEARFAIAPNHDVTVGSLFVCPPGFSCPKNLVLTRVERNMVRYDYGGSFVYNITGGTARPFLAVGIGGIVSDVQPQLRNDLAFQAGGGIKLYFQNIGLRLEVADQMIPYFLGRGKLRHDVQIQYGFFLRL